MIALVKHTKGEGHVSLSDRPIPVCGEDEVLIKVAYGGICGTDIHILHDQFAYYPPVILGHEFSGEVAAVGGKVTGYLDEAEEHTQVEVIPLHRAGRMVEYILMIGKEILYKARRFKSIIGSHFFSSLLGLLFLLY